MSKNNKTKIPDKLTDSEKKKLKQVAKRICFFLFNFFLQANKAKQNPALAAAKKAKNEAKVARRKEAGTTKTFK